MAIVSNLPAGAVLWKFEGKRQVYRYDPEQQLHRHMMMDCYYTVTLYTRRARTNGAVIDKSLVPFMEKLKIRLHKGEHWVDGAYQDTWQAIGVHVTETFDRERWEAQEIHETALKYYKKLKNKNISTILDRRSLFSEEDLIGEMRQAALDDESDVEWPDEPSIPVYDSRVGAEAW